MLLRLVGVFANPLFHRLRVALEFIKSADPAVSIVTEPLTDLAFAAFKIANKIDSAEPALVLSEHNFPSSKAFLDFAASTYRFVNSRPAALYTAMANQAVKAARNPNHDYVFLQFSVDSKPLGRVVIELHKDAVPRTCENFKNLCTGEKGFSANGARLHYKDTPLHRIEPRGWIQAGDIVNGSGSKGESTFGGTFADENFVLKHDKRGVVSMANAGPHTNGSQFFITLGPLPSFDSKFVAFGEVVDGADTLAALEALQTYNSRPVSLCVITDSGLA